MNHLREESTEMPLVRIDMVKRPDPDFAKRVGKVVYQSMRSTINVPVDDNFQILSEHDRRGLNFEPSYLGIGHTDELVLVQITLNEGRTLEQKKLLFKSIADGLAELGMRREDVLVNLVEVKKENWSFGNGVAQYAV
jgi:phenylpyruvate tautomerase PptA (4-oxalocrotonate tautomerase family)